MELKKDSRLKHLLDKYSEKPPIIFWVGFVLTLLALIAITLSIQGVVIMLLWNWLVPTLFGGVVITFFQSIGLGLLISVLFGLTKGSSSK